MRARGFTLVELAVVTAIIGLLMVSVVFTLGARVDQQNRQDTQRSLDSAKEFLLAFAIANARLPCPATATSNGEESPVGGGTCTSPYQGFLPGKTLGFQPTDQAGFAVDAWGNRIRYAIAQTSKPVATAPYTTAHTAVAPWSLSRMPTDLTLCSDTASATACTSAAATLVSQNTVVAIVFSTGKNGTAGTAGTNESRNLDNNGLFVSRPPDPSTAAGGEFDDMVAWIPVTVLYNRMVAAGVLP